jgi:uncharacterized UBP type Zn finger protein
MDRKPERATRAMSTAKPCTHEGDIVEVTPKTRGCAECEAAGGTWQQLRLCLICGHVGCCDSSPGSHATAHFRETGHPIIQSAQPGESWRWCFVDETYLMA